MQLEEYKEVLAGYLRGSGISMLPALLLLAAVLITRPAHKLKKAGSGL